MARKKNPKGFKKTLQEAREVILTHGEPEGKYPRVQESGDGEIKEKVEACTDGKSDPPKAKGGKRFDAEVGDKAIVKNHPLESIRHSEAKTLFHEMHRCYLLDLPNAVSGLFRKYINFYQEEEAMIPPALLPSWLEFKLIETVIRSTKANTSIDHMRQTMAWVNLIDCGRLLKEIEDKQPKQIG